MKKCYLLLAFVFLLLLSACGSKEPEKPLVEQIDEQLTGTWISYDSVNVYSKWTFYDGKYVAETYVNGELIPNSVVGVYSIGTEAIKTVTTDQSRNVEGSIPFTFENGKLMLHGANGDLVKQ